MEVGQLTKTKNVTVRIQTWASSCGAYLTKVYLASRFSQYPSVLT